MKKNNGVSLINLLAKLLIVAFLMLGAFSQSTLAQDEEGNRAGFAEKKVSQLQGSKFIINGHLGDLNVIGWDGSEIEATTETKIPLTIKEEGNKYILLPRTTTKQGSYELYIKLPKGVDLEISDKKSGDVTIDNIAGNLSLSMLSGDITINKAGTVDISLASGDVNVENVGTALVKVKRGDVKLQSVKGNANITSFSGDISIENVEGDATCKSLSGDVTVNFVTGLVNMSLSSGSAELSNLEGDLLVSAISSDINAKCVKGRVDINDAHGSIELEDISDDVQVVTVNGDINIQSPIRSKGRYSLKTTSGDISFAMQEKPPGFRVDMFCYNGEIETDFELKIDIDPKSAIDPVDKPDQVDPVDKHNTVNKTTVKRGRENLVGRYGDGQTQIKLSTFTGKIVLSKITDKSSSVCN